MNLPLLQKRCCSIRLNRGVEESMLESIAQEVVDREVGQYMRTWILFYLPEMEVGKGAWAHTCTFYRSTSVDFDISPDREKSTRAVGSASYSGPPYAELIEALFFLQERLAKANSRFSDYPQMAVDIQHKITEVKAQLARKKDDG